MKKCITLLLCAVMVLGCFAGCSTEGKGGNETINTFSVGFGRVDISPTESVPLRGYGDALERMSTGVMEALYVTCVAFTDADNQTVLLLATDLCNSFDSVIPDARSRISEATGIPVDHILFTASHNHSGPDLERTGVPSVVRYIETFKGQAVDAAQQALADRAPATMETTFSRPEGINTVRHYLLADGSFLGEGVGAISKSQLIGHTSRVDNLLQLVKFTREGAKDIVMINWQGHPRNNEPNPYTAATSNYVGTLRAEVEAQLDCNMIYILSGSGNVNNGSQIAADLRHTNYMELGEVLAEEVVKASANYTASNTGKLQLLENVFTVTRKDGMTAQAPLYAFSFGDFACVTAPYEVFDITCMAVRDASKYKMTFIASCANVSMGYLPVETVFDYYPYEVRVTQMAQGTAEQVQEQLTQMLDTIFASSGNEIVDKGEGYNTPALVPTTDGVTYTNPMPGQLDKYTEVENGFYQIALLAGTKSKIMLVKDKETVEKVLAQASMQLLFDEQSVIVGVVE